MLNNLVGAAIVILIFVFALIFTADYAELKRIEGEILSRCVTNHRAYEIEKTEYGYSCVKYDEKGQKHSIEVGL